MDSLSYEDSLFNADYIDIIEAFKTLLKYRQHFAKESIETSQKINDPRALIEMFFNKIYENTKKSNNKTVKSGWEKYMETLGLEDDLYNKPLETTKICLGNVYRATEKSTKTYVLYEIVLSMRKEMSKTMMLLNLEIVNISGNLFINNINILGFLSNNNIDEDLRERNKTIYNLLKGKYTLNTSENLWETYKY